MNSIKKMLIYCEKKKKKRYEMRSKRTVSNINEKNNHSLGRDKFIICFFICPRKKENPIREFHINQIHYDQD
jgi:hypothetical protein